MTGPNMSVSRDWRARIIPSVVSQHVEDAVVLYEVRTRLARAAHVRLHHLARFDRRLDAALDAISIAGAYGESLCTEGLADPSAGASFTATVNALDAGSTDRLTRLLALAEAVPIACQGVTAAFGWVEARVLQGTVAALLGAQDAFRRTMGISACSMHRVHPAADIARSVQHGSGDARARSLRAAGELAARELIRMCIASASGDDPETRFWGAWSAVLLGDRGTAVQVLTDTAFTAARHRSRALRLLLQATAAETGHQVLQRLAADSSQFRSVLEGSGIVGDPAYVPWLIGQMSDDRRARSAGEAFSLITGADVALLDLERKPPVDFESGPNNDPEDSNVAMDPDEGLPWPDPDRVQRWWNANSSRFTPGQRHFMGAQVTREHCIEVLKNGYQRQRILAAHYLCLLEPGTPLFNTSAPAWRQQRLLAGMH